jgi:para-nitrobenzyl esterase
MTGLILALLALTCPPSGELTFVCGAQHPEDLAHIGGTPWLIASGFSDGAGLKLIDTRNDTVSRWYTGAPEQIQPDTRLYPDCPSAPDAAVFNAHGINLKQQTLYVVNHGGRESIEVFSVTEGEGPPGLVWKGCVLMPEGMAANSVAAYRDGTILASVLTRPGTTITDFVQGGRTGAVFQWKPGTKAFELIPGTELPGNNGLETSLDDQRFYVVAFGWHAVVVFSRAHPDEPSKVVVAPGFMPDNIHWDGGRLLAAGMQLDEPACGGSRKIVNGKADDMRCHRGFSVAELDPATLTFNMVAYSGPNADFNGVSAAVIVGNQLWLGSYQADRVAHRTLMQPAMSGDPVATTSGQVTGVQLKSGVRAYLGIRYAAPPTQNLRWKPPQPIHWDGVWVADRKGAECIQVLRPHNINHYFGEEPSGEDCLYLNIWTPAGAKDRPVIVFLYGGGGTIGSSGMALYDGDTVAAHGAVFVSLNYRVGALGFMAHPQLTREQGGHSGNYGYLDQNAALQWIHANIAAFGGDPSKVLLAGQSFGAGSVAAQMFSPLSKGLFRGAAMWSACNFTTSGPDLQTAEQAGLDLQHRLGAADLEAMRYVPADRILAQQTESQVGAKVQGVRTPPLIDGYFTVGPKGNVPVDVPIMVSSNGDDLDANMSPLTRAKTVQEYEAIARELYGADAGKFLSLFPAKKDADVYAAAHAAARESGMLKASRSCAQKQNGSPAYISLFSHKHPYSSDVKFADQDPVTVGAYHSADIPYWLGTFDAFNLFRVTRVWTDYDRHLSDAMLQALIHFAATGSPDSADLKWPAWSARKEQYLSLGDEITANRLQAERMDWLAAHPAAAAESPPVRTTPRD